MNWEAFWNQQAEADKTTAQVGRINAGELNTEQLHSRLAAHISQQLALQPNDHLLDVCCGNGELTALLAPKTAFCMGVDLSPKLIELAKAKHQQQNLHFRRANALQLSGLGRTFNKINLYFSFQYFEDYETGLRVLSEMNALLAPGGRIFIGDTPDATRWRQYYKSPAKIARYYYQKWRGTEAMGKFWHPKEFEKMAEWLGLEVQILPEPADLPYAWYRFDAVFMKALA
jgi:ubiquinone/menaquinone biosynthesis C-methylase UbiE